MRKGQAATEFIMTYGWAILAVLVAIGCLAYFGVINPAKYFPEKCMFASGINCKDYKVYEDSGTKSLIVKITIENKLQDTVRLDNVTIRTKGGTYENATCITPNTVFPQDTTQAITCPLPPGSSLGVGEKAVTAVIITYRDVSGGFPHIINGDVQANIQAQ